MRRILVVAACLSTVTLAASVHSQGTNRAQVTMENKVDRTLDLYVNGNYGCRALAGLECTAQIPTGPQLWEAKDGATVVSSANTGDVQPGASLVWTVCYLTPDHSRCR